MTSLVGPTRSRLTVNDTDVDVGEEDSGFSEELESTKNGLCTRRGDSRRVLSVEFFLGHDEVVASELAKSSSSLVENVRSVSLGLEESLRKEFWRRLSSSLEKGAEDSTHHDDEGESTEPHQFPDSPFPTIGLSSGSTDDGSVKKRREAKDQDRL